MRKSPMRSLNATIMSISSTIHFPNFEIHRAHNSLIGQIQTLQVSEAREIVPADKDA